MDRRRRPEQLTLVLLAGLVSCAEPAGDPADRTPGDYPLVTPAAWTATPTASDPFATDTTEGSGCPSTTFGAEMFGAEEVFSVNGAGCAWLTVQQPLAHEVRPGDQLRVRLWNFSLTGPAGSAAHIALHAGDTPLWGVEVPIPAPSHLYVDTVVVNEALPAGTPVYFHVDNHGSNSYSLFEVTLTVPPPGD